MPLPLIRPSQSTQGWLGSQVVSVLDSGAEGPGFKSQPQRCWVTVLGRLFISIAFSALTLLVGNQEEHLALKIV